jgi:hypothetical protein
MTDESDLIIWGVALRVYWTILWRGLAIYLAIVAPFQALLLWLLATERLDETSHFILLWVVALPSLIAGGLIAVRMVLRKRYRGFTLQIRREPLS